MISLIVLLSLFALGSAQNTTDCVCGPASSMNGNGTMSSPFMICTVNQWNSIGTNFTGGSYWKLCDNLVFSGKFRPVGNQSVPFVGNFDGNGFRVAKYNLRAKQRLDTATSYIGLFGSVHNSTITNLTIKNVVMQSSGQRYVGALAGSVVNSTISYIFSNVFPEQLDDFCGGLFGSVMQSFLHHIFVTGRNSWIGYGQDAMGVVAYSIDRSHLSDIRITGSMTYNDSFFPSASLIGSLAGSVKNSQVSNVDITNPIRFIDLSLNILDPDLLIAPDLVGGVAGSSVNNTYTNVFSFCQFFIRNVAITQNVGNRVNGVGHNLGLLFGESVNDTLTNVDYVPLCTL